MDAAIEKLKNLKIDLEKKQEVSLHSLWSTLAPLSCPSLLRILLHCRSSRS